MKRDVTYRPGGPMALGVFVVVVAFLLIFAIGIVLGEAIGRG